MAEGLAAPGLRAHTVTDLSTTTGHTNSSMHDDLQRMAHQARPFVAAASLQWTRSGQLKLVERDEDHNMRPYSPNVLLASQFCSTPPPKPRARPAVGRDLRPIRWQAWVWAVSASSASTHLSIWGDFCSARCKQRPSGRQLVGSEPIVAIVGLARQLNVDRHAAAPLPPAPFGSGRTHGH